SLNRDMLSIHAKAAFLREAALSRGDLMDWEWRILALLPNRGERGQQAANGQRHSLSPAHRRAHSSPASARRVSTRNAICLKVENDVPMGNAISGTEIGSSASCQNISNEKPGMLKVAEQAEVRDYSQPQECTATH